MHAGTTLIYANAQRHDEAYNCIGPQVEKDPMKGRIRIKYMHKCNNIYISYDSIHRYVPVLPISMHAPRNVTLVPFYLLPQKQK